MTVNKPRFIARGLLFGFLATMATAAAQAPSNRPPPGQIEKKGLLQNEQGAFEGYTLFAPLRSETTYLIDLNGEVVHTWKSTRAPGNSAYLLDNGHLLRSTKDPDNPRFRQGGAGGGIQEFDWDGNLLWDFTYSSPDYLQHHDIEPLPNGNVLLIAWEVKDAEEARAHGRNPQFIQGQEFWPCYVLEIKPEPPEGGKTVWEWHSWDHMIQNMDPELENYGDPAEHPELININADHLRRQRADEEVDRENAQLRGLGYLGGPPQDNDRRGQRDRGSADWLHTNSIDYNAELDQIALSVRRTNELWIIDHSTTTEEAAGHTGGKSGMGGDLLYRWGNPAAWDAGIRSDRQLFGQHDVQWIEDDCPGSGNLTLYNNGTDRPDGNFSTVLEIEPPIQQDGTYHREKDGAFGPAEPENEITRAGTERFFSGHISGAQKLPNGNTLICVGDKGRFIEVTNSGDVVWEYVNPFEEPPSPEGRAGSPGRRGPQGGGRDRRSRRGGRGGGPPGGNGGGVFRATRISPDHPGLKNLKKEV